MSHYYGGVEGGRGPATRTGTKRSGLQAYAKSWKTRVSVEYRHHDGVDCVEVRAVDLNGGGRERVLWEGPEAELLAWLTADAV